MTRREIIAAIAGAAIVAAASHYAGPLGGKIAEKTLVPVVQERILEPGIRKPGGEITRIFEIGPKPVRHVRPTLIPPASCGSGGHDAAYYRALHRAGVFPVTTHEARP